MASFPISRSPSKLVALIVPLLVQGRSVLLQRTATTNATCGSEFSWMENSEGQAPCLLASLLSGACSTGNWNVPPVNSSQVYNPPSVVYANYCSCSWAVYNLLEACTACQDDNNILNWGPYSINCENYLTDTAFPSDKIMPPTNTLIPYWSAIDPTTWTNGQFNVTQAQSTANGNHPDINLSSPTPTTKKSSTSFGIIAGGVVEGIIGAVLVTVAVPILCLRRYRQRTSARMTTPDSECIRVTSNTWQQAGPATLIDTRQSPTPSTVYSSISFSGPIMHSFQPPQSSVVQMSVQPVANAAVTGNPEDLISRPTLASTQRDIYPIYEESWPSPAVSTRSGRRPTYIESQVDDGNWEPALTSSHFPAAYSVDRIGRVHRPKIAVGSMNWTITPDNRDGTAISDTTEQMPLKRTFDLDDPITIRPDSGRSGSYLSARSSFDLCN